MGLRALSFLTLPFKTRFVEAHEWLGLLSGMMTKHAINWVALKAVPPLDQSFDNQTLLGMVMGKRMVALDGDRRRPPDAKRKVEADALDDVPQWTVPVAAAPRLDEEAGASAAKKAKKRKEKKAKAPPRTNDTTPGLTKKIAAPGPTLSQSFFAAPSKAPAVSTKAPLAASKDDFLAMLTGKRKL